MSTVVTEIDERGALEFLSQMIRRQSYCDTPGEIALAHFMVEAMARIGLDAVARPIKGERCNAVGVWKGTGSGPTLLFNGHLDTNPVTGGWTVDPLAGLVDDKFIYGIGVSNMKAGDAAYFWAVKSLMDAGVRLKGDVVLTYVVGELQGGIGTRTLLDQGLRADYFINAEPTDLAALTLHAGSFNYVVELHGSTRHVSKREEAVDAIAIGAELVPLINSMTFSGALNEEHRSVNRANVGIFRGALTPEFHEWRPPQVADFVRLSGTCRYAPSQSIDSCLADLRRLLDAAEARHPGLRATVARAGPADRPTLLPFEVARGSRIVSVLNSAFKKVRGVEQVTGPTRPSCFFGTDAAHFQHRAGIEGVVCGPGGRYNTMPDERVDIADFLDMIRIYMHAILEICGPA